MSSETEEVNMTTSRRKGEPARIAVRTTQWLAALEQELKLGEATIADLKKRKGLEFSVQMFTEDLKLLKRQIADAKKLVVAGKPFGKAEAELMAKERKSRVVVIHADDRLAGILSVADIIERAPQREALHGRQPRRGDEGVPRLVGPLTPTLSPRAGRGRKGAPAMEGAWLKPLP